jgi:hypothetical protein
MSAPAALVMSKLMYPEYQKSVITDEFIRNIKDV